MQWISSMKILGIRPVYKRCIMERYKSIMRHSSEGFTYRSTKQLWKYLLRRWSITVYLNIPLKVLRNIDV